MQQFLKQQAKERALSASLPLISEKREARTFMRNLKGKLIQTYKDALTLDQPKTNLSVSNSNSGRNAIAKRYANSFSSFGNRQVPKYAHVQLQKQYKEWEERRQKKKLEEQPVTNLTTSDNRQNAELSLSSKETTLLETTKNSPNRLNSPHSQSSHTRSDFDKSLKQEESQNFDKSILLNQQRASISVPNRDVDIPQPKKIRPMTTDFSELKFKTRPGRTSTRTRLLQIKNGTNKITANSGDATGASSTTNSSTNLPLKR